MSKQVPVDDNQSKHGPQSPLNNLSGGNDGNTPQKEIPQMQRVDDEINEYMKMLPLCLICQLCEKLVIRSSTTVCGHVFCQVCLLEYLVYIQDCPVCSTCIRQQTYSKNLSIDNMVRQFLTEVQKQSEDQYFVKQYEIRKQKNDAYITDMKLKSFHSTQKIDAQDHQGIWRTAKIIKISNSSESHDTPVLTLKFDGLTKKQMIKGTSHRIAQLGFYTDRQEIPKMSKGKVVIKDMEGEDGLLVVEVKKK